MKRNVSGQKIGAQLVSAADGSAFTGAATVEVTIDAGTQATGTVGSGAATHEGNGYHTYAPSQAETNGDLIAFTFHGTGPVPATVQVYTAFPQTGDSFVKVNQLTFTNANKVDAAIVAAGDFAQAAADKVWATAARTLTAFSFAVDLSAAAVTLIWDKATSALTTAGSIGKLLVDNVNATISSRSSHAAADVWAVGSRTLTAFSFAVDISAAAVTLLWDKATSALTTVGSVGKLIVDNLNATVSSRSSHTAADVWTSGTRTLTSFGTLVADTATAVWAAATRTLTDISAPLLALFFTRDTTKTYAADAVAGSVVKEIADNSGGGTPPTAGAIADAVWDEALAGHVAAGSTGEALGAAGGAGDPWITALPGAYTAGQAGHTVGTNLDATVSSRSSHAAADVWTSGTRTLTSFGTLVADIWASATRTVTDLSAELLALFFTRDTTKTYAGDAVAGSVVKEIVDNAGGGTPPTAGAIADAVWDEVLADHVAAGSAGEALGAAGVAGDPWIAELPGAYGDGSAGQIVGDMKAQTAAAVWDEALAGHVAPGSAGEALDDVKAQTDLLPSGVKRNTQPDGPFVFVMVLASDHITPAPGLVVTAECSTDAGLTFVACVNPVVAGVGGLYGHQWAAEDLPVEFVAFRYTAETADARIITVQTKA